MGVPDAPGAMMPGRDQPLPGRRLAQLHDAFVSSGAVADGVRPVVSEFTVGDAGLYDSMRLLLQTEGIFLEPSACAA